MSDYDNPLAYTCPHCGKSLTSDFAKDERPSPGKTGLYLVRECWDGDEGCCETVVIFVVAPAYAVTAYALQAPPRPGLPGMSSVTWTAAEEDK